MSKQEFKELFTTVLGPEAINAQGQVELVYAERELVARAVLSLDEQWVVTDLFARDLRAFRTDSGPALLRAILTLNNVAARIGDYSIGIDERETLIVTGRLPLKGLTADEYAAAMVRWLDLVDDLREVVSAIGMEKSSITLGTFEAAPSMEIQI